MVLSLWHRFVRLLRCFAPFISAALSFCPSAGQAWNAPGHAAVALIAERLLTPYAEERVTQLLALEGSHNLAEVSSWADEIRSEGLQHGPHHTVGIPINAENFDPGRDCKERRCVVLEIEDNLARLKSPQVPDEEKLIALKYVVHFIGDVHQPFHGIKGRGANIDVVADGQTMSLHKFWDMSATGPGGAASLAARLPTGGGSIGSMDPVRWALESHDLARQSLMELGMPPKGAVVTLSQDYISQAHQIGEDRVLQAGVRLAAALNEALK